MVYHQLIDDHWNGSSSLVNDGQLSPCWTWCWYSVLRVWAVPASNHWAPVVMTKTFVREKDPSRSARAARGWVGQNVPPAPRARMDVIQNWDINAKNGKRGLELVQVRHVFVHFIMKYVISWLHIWFSDFVCIVRSLNCLWSNQIYPSGICVIYKTLFTFRLCLCDRYRVLKHIFNTGSLASISLPDFIYNTYNYSILSI